MRFHTALLSEIQEGLLEWGGDYHRLEQQILMPYPISRPSKLDKKTDRVNKGSRNFQRKGEDEELLAKKSQCLNKNKVLLA